MIIFQGLALLSGKNFPFPKYCRRIIVGLLMSPSISLSFRSLRNHHKPGLKYSIRQGDVPFQSHIYESKLLFSSFVVDDVAKAYKEGETDGILQYASSHDVSSGMVDDIITSTLEISEGRSGEAASMLNAWIGACSLIEDEEEASSLALGLMEAFEDLEEERNISPDIVSYSLAYSVLHEHKDLDVRNSGAYYLEQATRRSKKLAGGKRRKTLAAMKRKGRAMSVKEREEDLRKLCGQEFTVLYETDSLCVINKPSGIPCFHRKTTTAGKIRKRKGSESAMAQDVSIEDALIACNVPLSTMNPEALGLVHRLDRGSSGCLVLAKTDAMHALLVAEFFLRKTKKLYTTIVSPAPSTTFSDEGTIEHPVDGRPAKSQYRIIQRLSQQAAILEFEIFTGRKHQIRVHAAQVLNSPVYMDAIYGNGEEQGDPSGEKFLLHASQLQIPKYHIAVNAPQPLWWEDVLAKLVTKE